MCWRRGWTVVELVLQYEDCYREVAARINSVATVAGLQWANWVQDDTGPAHLAFEALQITFATQLSYSRSSFNSEAVVEGRAESGWVALYGAQRSSGADILLEGC